MGKYANPLIMDNGLNHIKNQTTRLVGCQGQPLTYADASSAVPTGNLLGDLGSMTVNDFVVSDDPGGGRRVTILTQVLLMTYAGSFDHLALIDDTNSQLLYTLPVTAAQTVVGGNTVTTPDVDITIANPI